VTAQVWKRFVASMAHVTQQLLRIKLLCFTQLHVLNLRQGNCILVLLKSVRITAYHLYCLSSCGRSVFNYFTSTNLQFLHRPLWKSLTIFLYYSTLLYYSLSLIGISRSLLQSSPLCSCQNQNQYSHHTSLFCFHTSDLKLTFSTDHSLPQIVLSIFFQPWITHQTDFMDTLTPGWFLFSSPVQYFSPCPHVVDCVC